jgi:uncharacterized protein YdcH (DUF465 family)
MSIDTQHDLHSEFPNDGDILHALKLEDAHFRTIADRYHDLNREIHRIESEVEAASDERLEGLKKQRLALLDDVATMISTRRSA